MSLLRTIMLSVVMNGTTEVLKNTNLIYKAENKLTLSGEELGGVRILEHTWDGKTKKGLIICESDIVEILDSEFSYNYDLLEITLPNSVRSIGVAAFYNCSGLTSVTIGNRVTSIGSSAFDSCSSLTSINIPDSVTEIGYSAFDGCSSLTSINIPDGVTSIGSDTFEDCSSLTSIVIPDSVTSIGNRAFYGCSGLTGELVIPDSVTSIGTYAFYNCTGELVVNCNIPHSSSSSYSPFYNSKFTKVTIGDGVTSIGNRAFDGCSSLTSIVIPDSVTSIGQYAFYGCSGLTSKLAIPNSVTSIGTYAFCNCSKLRGELVIPGSVTSIGEWTFSKTSLTSVTIGNSVTSIGDYAFRECTSLTSVTIGNSVTSIGKYAFEYCSSLTGVYITDLSVWCKISFNNSSDSPLSYAKNLYLNGELVTELVIPEGVTSIGRYAFSGCSSLTSIVIPDSVTSISGAAFAECSSLTSVTIGNGVTEIGGNAFGGCTGELVVNCNIPDYSYSSNSPFYNSKFTKVTFGNGVTKIGKYAFYGCSGLTSIVIPDSVTYIGSYAFQNCSGLTSIVIPDSVTSIGTYAFQYCSSLTSVTIGNGVTKIGDHALRGCSGLTSIIVSAGNTTYDSRNNCNAIINTATNALLVGCKTTTIPDSVASIGTYAFYNCSGLTSIVIPDSVTSIGVYAFNGCSGLTSVTIPDSVTSIGESVFQNCGGLTSIVIPDSVTTIAISAFNGCSGLTSVTIPDSVTSIGQYAFSNCSSLTSIICKPQTPPSLGLNALSAPTSFPYIYVPMESVEAYKSATNWKAYASKITASYVPSECTKLTITAENADGRATTTKVYYTAITNGYNVISGENEIGITVTGEGISDEFLQNTSTTDTIEREVTFTYLGMTASTTITQGVWINNVYTVDLNNNWELTTAVSNPDTSLYDGVYRSYSNKGVNNGVATMYVDINGYETFKLYIRSYAESNYDYVMVSQLDQSINGSTSYSNTTLVKAHTRGKQNSSTSISGYTLVEFTGIDKGKHRITIVYRKDSSANSGDDRGYVLIPKEQ